MTVIALTGASGYIGQKLLARLEADPKVKKILAIDVREPKMELEKTDFIRADVRHPLIAEILKTNKVNTIIHLAFVREPTHNPALAHEMDVIGSLKVLNACTAAKIKKIIMTSSTVVYGAHPNNPNFLTEDMPLRANRKYQYANDKLEVEKLCSQFMAKNPDVILTILRPAMVLGPNARHFIARLMNQAIIPTMMGYDPLLQFIHEDDLVEAFCLCLKYDLRGAYNVVADGVIPLNKVIKITGKIHIPLLSFIAYPLIDILWHLRLVETPSSQLDYMRYQWVASGEKFKKATGFQPRYTSEETVIDFVESYRVKRYMEKDKEELLIPDVSTSPSMPGFYERHLKSLSADKATEAETDDSER